MKRIVLTFVASLAIGLLGTAVANAHTAQKGSLQVTHPWVAPAEKGASTTGHPTITNKGDASITLTGASSKAAHAVNLVLDGERVDRVSIDGGETLPPQRFRLRLENLIVALPEGKAVPVKLHLSKQDAIDVRMAIGQDTMNPKQMVQMPGVEGLLPVCFNWYLLR